MDDMLLELVKNVASFDARLNNVDMTLKTVTRDVAELKTMAHQAKGFSTAAKMLYALLGLLAGAGGTNAAQTFFGG